MDLFKNGVSFTAADTPSVTAFLEAHPGAYTTTRTHSNGSKILFWEKHMRRISSSVGLLLKANPTLLFPDPNNFNNNILRELSYQIMNWDASLRCLVDDSMRKVMPIVVKNRKFEQELAIMILVSGKPENLCNAVADEDRVAEVFDVYLHIGEYVPPVFGVKGNGAYLALVGRGRDYANAKYSSWVRQRKLLEKLRAPLVTELLLSNDGDRILEGCLTNFFVVCRKEKDANSSTVEQNGDFQSLQSMEVQTAPVNDGVLPGVIRQVIRDICLKIGIPYREVAPSWSERRLWTEAFITSSLRIVQHVELVQAPKLWESLKSSSTWEETTWTEKRFEDGPGRITSILQKEIMKTAIVESIPITSF